MSVYPLYEFTWVSDRENSLFGDSSVWNVTTHSYVLQEGMKKTCEFILYAEIATAHVTYFQHTDPV